MSMVKDSISHYDDMIGVDDIEDAVTELTEWMNDLDDDEREELRVLSALLEEINDYGVEGYLIRESYFEEYVKELVEDCGDIPRDLPHYIYIDWEKTADAIKVDYTEFDFNGVTYLGR